MPSIFLHLQVVPSGIVFHNFHNTNVGFVRVW
jgi:hypothetical protein